MDTYKQAAARLAQQWADNRGCPACGSHAVFLLNSHEYEYRVQNTAWYKLEMFCVNCGYLISIIHPESLMEESDA